MKLNKKGQEAAASGFNTLVAIAIIIGITIAILIITLKYTDVGRAAWAKITDIFAFV